MESVLQKITDAVKKREKNNFEIFSFGDNNLKTKRKPIDIISILKKGFFYIFEIKKASPSKGIIRKNFNPLEILESYEKAGASAISVITEPEFFMGSKNYLKEVKEKTGLPVLRKDFLIHPFQIYEAYNLGADFLLLIAACLSDSELKLLYDITLSLGMNALIEVHNEPELVKALKVKPKLIGINNRDLATFKVDMDTSYKLQKMIPSDIFVISESGIKTHDDLQRLKEEGFSGVLIGESLLNEDDIYSAARSMING
jgi:indole-3-glycerol phosphate synthase